MLQKISLLAITTLLVSSLAHAALENLEHSYELGLNEVQLPGHTSGNVVIRTCPECSPTLHRVNSRTVYRLSRDDRDVTLRELLRVARHARDAAVYVAIATDTGDVSRIELSVWD